MANATRLTWIDALRLTAGLSMIGLHATADPTGGPWSEYSATERIAPIALRTVLYIARTELFIIISVFLLILALDRRPRAYRTVVAEQSKRLLLPFLFWTAFFAIYGLVKAAYFGYFSSAISEIASVTNWVSFILLGDVKYHMHFIPTLVGVLLFYPLYQAAVKSPGLGILVLVALATKSELDAFIYREFWGTDLLPYLVRSIKILTYTGYGIVAGAAYGLLKTHSTEKLKGWTVPIFYATALLCLIKCVAAYKTIQTGQYQFTYYPGYWADFLMPLCLFLLCLSQSALNWPRVLTTLAKYSFGLYLCHPIFLDAAEIAVKNRDLSPIAQILVKITIVLPATGILVFTLGKTQSLAWTIGLGRPNHDKRTPKQEPKWTTRLRT